MRGISWAPRSRGDGRVRTSRSGISLESRSISRATDARISRHGASTRRVPVPRQPAAPSARVPAATQPRRRSRRVTRSSLPDRDPETGRDVTKSTIGNPFRDGTYVAKDQNEAFRARPCGRKGGRGTPGGSRNEELTAIRPRRRCGGGPGGRPGRRAGSPRHGGDHAGHRRLLRRDVRPRHARLLRRPGGRLDRGGVRPEARLQRHEQLRDRGELPAVGPEAPARRRRGDRRRLGGHRKDEDAPLRDQLPRPLGARTGPAVLHDRGGA